MFSLYYDRLELQPECSDGQGGPRCNLIREISGSWGQPGHLFKGWHTEEDYFGTIIPGSLHGPFSYTWDPDAVILLQGHLVELGVQGPARSQAPPERLLFPLHAGQRCRKHPPGRGHRFRGQADSGLAAETAQGGEWQLAGSVSWVAGGERMEWRMEKGQRIRSFYSWPRWTRASLEQLARAGFLCTGLYWCTL